MNSPAELDIGPLSWVKDEIEIALGRVAEQLHNYAATPEAAFLVDARAHLHQAHGALAIVGLDGITEFSRVIERLVEALAAGEIPWSSAVGDAAQEGIDALNQYLDEVVAGRPNQPLRLFSAYRALCEARGETGVAASDLFFPDLTQRPPRRDAAAPTLDAEARQGRLKAARLGFERGLAKWFKLDTGGVRDMRNSIAIIEATQEQPAQRAFWWVALAYFDALAAGASAADEATQRLCVRIEAQVRKLLDGTEAVAERLMRDVLYEVATSEAGSEHIEQVRAAYRLGDMVPSTTAPDDPQQAILRDMRDRLAAASESWDQFCAGAAIALPHFHEHSAQLLASAQLMSQVDLARLVAALANTANLLRKNPLLYGDELGIEVATALLLTEQAVNHFDALEVDFAAQVDAITSRLNSLQQGESPAAPELPALRDLSQRAARQLAVHHLARNLRAQLLLVEQGLDAYFRDAGNAAALAGVGEPLKKTAAMFTELDAPRAVEVVGDCARAIGMFAAPGHARQPGEFEEVARKISALGFFIEQLQRGPADLDALLAPVAAGTGTMVAPSVEAELSQQARMAHTLVGVMLGREGTAPQDDEAREALRSELKQNLEGLRDNARLVADEAAERQADAALTELDGDASPQRIEEIVAPLAAASAADAGLVTGESKRLAEASAAEADSELLAIFIEEVLQVLDTVGVELFRSMADPADSEHLVVLRRGFHTLKGSSRMVGLKDFSEAARAVETTLGRHLQSGRPASAELHAMVDTAQHIVSDWVERLQRHASAPDAAPLLRQCAALREAEHGVVARLDVIKPESAKVVPTAAVDSDLLPVFLEECHDLLPVVVAAFEAWRKGGGAEAVQRLLHTLKGSARMAGLGAIGEAMHGVETHIADAQAGAGGAAVAATRIDELKTEFDKAAAMIGALQAKPEERGTEAQRPMLRVRADLVDAMVNGAGEIAISRSRIEGGVKALRGSLADLGENVARLRAHLRELEIQSESSIQSQARSTPAAGQEFDPLEMDRFTRLQELTRILAESVNDVATVEHSLMRDLDQVDAALTQQARLSRELTQNLMGVRMVPLASIAERLQRVVRQTAAELGKQVDFSIEGTETELDRSVLEHMTAPIEHLLRNAVVHGVESSAQRSAAGKPVRGAVRLALVQAGNEVDISVSDDGSGLDYERIRNEAIKRGLIKGDQATSEAQLAQMIYQPGFTTASSLSAIAGRGVGMDVVKNETTALGGRVEVSSDKLTGTRFSLHLPLTLAVIPALLVKSGERSYAIPSAMVVHAREVKPDDMVQLRAAGYGEWQGQRYALHYLPQLLGDAAAQPAAQRRHWMILLRAGVQLIALEIDALVGNEELVIKNIGAQLARVPGISGATVLGDGEVVLIINPVTLAGRVAVAAPVQAAPAAPAGPPIVMVVDDSLTVRKITGRLLERAGYRVATAKDGVDALEQLAEVQPAVMLCDIEMPRMDGFELLRRLRADARFKSLPVIMITSRIADKHRNYAAELGVNHYIGKPYDEEGLLEMIAGYVRK